MKKFKVFGLILLAGAIAFTSCKKDEPEGPTLSVTANKTSAWQGDTITFTYTVASNAELEKLSYSTTASNLVPADEVALSGNSKNGTIDVVLPTSGVTEGTLTFTFTALDKDGEEYAATTTIAITLAPGTTSTPFNTTITGGTFYHIQGSLQGAWDLDGDALVSASGVASTKSMKNTDAAGATFTGSWTSDAANGTLFVETSTTYSSIDQETAASIYSGGTPSATVNNPAVNDVYVAKKGSTYYVIQITALDPNDNTCGCANKGKISFTYKK